MARITHTRTPSRRGNRKRMPLKKRGFKKRGKKSVSYTSRSLGGSGLQYRSKRISRSKWKKMLWDSTLQKHHYRSLGTVLNNLTTPANVVTKQVNIVSARFNGAGLFTAAVGGALDPIGGGAIPSFIGSVVLRGGTLRISITNPLDAVFATSGALQVECFLIRTGNNFNSGGIVAAQPLMWDPTYVGDFQINVGRILMRKTFLIRDGESADMEYRMPIQKVDLAEEGSNQNTYVWIVTGANVDNSTANTYRVTTSFNLSFAGDGL